MVIIMSESVLDPDLPVIKWYMAFDFTENGRIWQLGTESSSLIEIWGRSWRPEEGGGDDRRILALHLPMLTSESLKQVVSR